MPVLPVFFLSVRLLWLFVVFSLPLEAVIQSFGVATTKPSLADVSQLTPLGSNIVFEFDLEADPGNYRLIAFRNSNLSQVMAEENPLEWPGGAGTTSLRVPLTEGDNTWFFRILSLKSTDPDEATTSFAVPVARDLLYDVSKVSLNQVRTAQGGLGRFTRDRFATLDYTLLGTASDIQVEVLNNGAVVNTQTRPGAGSYSVGAIELRTNAENNLVVRARSLDPNAMGGVQVDSNLIQLVQDEVPPILTDLSTTFQQTPPAPGVPFGPTDLASFGVIVGTDTPFATVKILNQRTGNETVRQAQPNGRLTISGIELPRDPSLDVTQSTTTTYSLRIEDEAGNFAVRQFQVERITLEPCFNLLRIEPADGGSLSNEGSVSVQGAVCDASEEYRVVFEISSASTNESFEKEEQIRGLQAGEFFDKDISLPTSTLSPFENTAFNIQATVRTQGLNGGNQEQESPQHNLGTVVLDRKNPAAPVLLSNDAIIAFNAPGVTLEGVIERKSQLEFSGPSLIPITPSRKVSAVTSRFRSFFAFGSAPDGDYLFELNTRDRAGNTGAGSKRQLTFRLDRARPGVKRVLLNGSSIERSRPVFFKPGQTLRLGVITDERMLVPPRVFVTQRGDFAKEAGLASAGEEGLTFEYQYVVRPSQNGSTDGPVEVLVTGGGDLAGNPIFEHREPQAFIVDTLAPILSRTATQPADGSVIGTAPEPIRFVMLEHPQTPGEGSGPHPEKVRIRAFGPIEDTPNREITGRLEVFDPQTVDFFPDPELMNQDGTYLFELTLVDRVGNEFVETVILTLDLETLDKGLILSQRPAPDTFYNAQSLPVVQERLSLSIGVEPLLTEEMDLLKTEFALSNPIRTPTTYALDSLTMVSPVSVQTRMLDRLATDGTDDGVMVASARLVDTAGNVSDESVWKFVYDNLEPGVMDGLTFPPPPGFSVQDRREPRNQEIVKGPLRSVSALLFDRKTGYGFLGSGVNTALSTASGPTSTVVLRLQDSFGAAPPQEINTGTLKFRSEVTETAPNYGGPSVVRMLYELNVQNSSLEPLGLATDGSFDGIYSMQILAADMAGNASPISTSWFLYDTQKPMISVDVANEQWITSGVLKFEGIAQDFGERPESVHGFGTLLGAGVRRVEFRLDSVNEFGSATFPALMDWTELSLDRDPDTHDANASFAFSARHRFDYRGRARLTVRAYDAAGNVSRLLRDLSLDSSEIADPVLISPADGDSTAGGLQRFTWQAVEEAQSYTLVIDDAQGNENLFVFDEERVQVDVNLDRFDAGLLNWRVLAIDGSSQSSPGDNRRRLNLDRGGPEVVRLTTERPVIPPDEQGRILRSEVRFEAEFSEALHPEWPISALLEVEPKIYLNSLNQTIEETYPPLKIRTVSLKNNLWKGLLRLEPTDKGHDYNGIATVRINGFRDVASNAGEEFTTSLELDFGPWFEFRIFANPVQEQEVVFVIKGLNRKGGVKENIADLPYLYIRQFRTPNQESNADKLETVPLTRLGKSWFQGGFALDSGLSGSLRLEITGKDEQGNQTTRYVPFEIRRLDFQEQGQKSVSRTQWMLPQETLETKSGRMAVMNLLPEVNSGVDQTLMIDLSRYPMDPSSRVAAMRCQASHCDWMEQTRTGNQIVVPRGIRSDLRLIVDESPPKLESLHSEEELKALETDLEVEVVEPGVGLTPELVDVTLEGRQLDFTLQKDRLRVARSSLKSGVLQNLSVSVSDRLSNSAELSLQVARAAPVQILESVVVPNPIRHSRSFLRIRLSRTRGQLTMTAYDSFGARVGRPLVRTVRSSEMRIDLSRLLHSSLANGVYFLKVQAEDTDGNRVKKTIKLALLR